MNSNHKDRVLRCRFVLGLFSDWGLGPMGTTASSVELTAANRGAKMGVKRMMDLRSSGNVIRYVH